MKKEVISRRVKVTDDTTVSRLSLIDQVKLLIAQLSHPETERLRGQAQVLRREAISRSSTHKALREACESLSKSDDRYITISIKSSYLPYLEEIINPITGLGAGFNFFITDRPEDSTLDYDVYIKIVKKEV